jgi:hypothetical protein
LLKIGLFSSLTRIALYYLFFYKKSPTTDDAPKKKGQLKDIVTTSLGFFIFGDVSFHFANLAGVCLGLIGGMLYSGLSYRA